MRDDLLTGASPKTTEKLVEDWTAHVNATDALEGLTAEQAITKRGGGLSSIAEEVAHMLFWQRHAQGAGSVAATWGWGYVVSRRKDDPS